MSYEEDGCCDGCGEQVFRPGPCAACRLRARKRAKPRSRFTPPENTKFSGIRTAEIPVCDRCSLALAQGLVTRDGSQVLFGLCGHCTDLLGPSIVASGLSVYPPVLVGAS